MICSPGIACAFYGASPILIPPSQDASVLAQLLQETKAEIVFALAGTISHDDLAKSSQYLKHIVWCVEQKSRHMDFLSPETARNSSAYHDLIERNKENASSDLPSDTDIKNAPNVVSVWQGKNASSYEIAEFTQAVRSLLFVSGCK